MPSAQKELSVRETVASRKRTNMHASEKILGLDASVHLTGLYDRLQNRGKMRDHQSHGSEGKKKNSSHFLYCFLLLSLFKRWTEWTTLWYKVVWHIRIQDVTNFITHTSSVIITVSLQINYFAIFAEMTCLKIFSQDLDPIIEHASIKTSYYWCFTGI